MSVIDTVGIFGVVVFAVSGALAAGRHRMDPIGFILLGTITAIGGGSLRDVLLDRPVFWTEAPKQLVISIIAALITYFTVPQSLARKNVDCLVGCRGLSRLCRAGQSNRPESGSESCGCRGHGHADSDRWWCRSGSSMRPSTNDSQWPTLCLHRTRRIGCARGVGRNRGIY